MMLCLNFVYWNQGFLAQRRSNFQGNQFPLAAEAARKAANAAFRNRAFPHNQMANWKPRYFVLLIRCIPMFCISSLE